MKKVLITFAVLAVTAGSLLATTATAATKPVNWKTRLANPAALDLSSTTHPQAALRAAKGAKTAKIRAMNAPAIPGKASDGGSTSYVPCGEQPIKFKLEKKQIGIALLENGDELVFPGSTGANVSTPHAYYTGVSLFGGSWTDDSISLFGFGLTGKPGATKYVDGSTCYNIEIFVPDDQETCETDPDTGEEYCYYDGEFYFWFAMTIPVYELKFVSLWNIKGLVAPYIDFGDEDTIGYTDTVQFRVKK